MHEVDPDSAESAGDTAAVMGAVGVSFATGAALHMPKCAFASIASSTNDSDWHQVCGRPKKLCATTQ